MRWNCPHCGTSLAVSDEKLGNGWAFSRCYKCAGFALVRKGDANLIKVDRAPAGEHVLLPEANEDATALLSRQASEHLAHYVEQNAQRAKATDELSQARARIEKAAMKPGIKSATRRSLSTSIAEPAQALVPVAASVMVPAPAPSTQADRPSLAAAPPFVAPRAPASAGSSFGLPTPLPDEPVRGVRGRLAPVAIALTGVFAIGTGIYLYVQGQAIWEKSRLQAEGGSPTGISQELTSSEAVPAPAFAAGSGIMDQVGSKAMAPVRAKIPTRPAGSASH